jgi:hypothetical protein
MEKKALDAKLPFDKPAVVGCTDLDDLKVATIQIMDAFPALKDFIFGNVSSIKNLIMAKNSEILLSLKVTTKSRRM